MNLPSHPPSHASGGADVSPGQLLRELHGASLGGDGQTMEPAMRLALEAGFGGLGHWAAQFGACIQAMGGGSGWALLVFDPRTGTLRNQWVGDATEAFAAGTPLLALDLHEPARRANPGARGTYVDTCLAAIDWAGVHARYRAAVFAASEALGADPADVANGLVLDVRRAGVYESATTRLPQAIWRDPAAVAQWGADLPLDRPVTVYCVHGHEVSRAIALRLRAAGVDARYLRGGIDGWSRARHPLAQREVPC